jgi:hypothetical protein
VGSAFIARSFFVLCRDGCC